ncbi:hypothetical protein [Chitinophaga sp. LS1]|uniref:hypothetical protein n=1 Tax=Chitinophaga sp. LS1 TaxID=3051176 RepID=UPI002AAAB16D|nr:hypothetical protein [Chitinophaga sp. LS1]WPV66275.1 hypothetical protein QQL36_31245 [Chitinophaga sp. LS1]
MKIKNIFIGWGKRIGFLPTSEAEKRLSQLRLKQCGNCHESKVSQILKIVNGEGNYENQLGCDKCGCPCLEKSLVVNEHCPIGKW